MQTQKKTAQMQIFTKDLFLALAKQVPDPKGSKQLIANPYKNWREINADLPDAAIEVLGPPPTSGTRDAFVELAMEAGCNQFDWLATIKNTDKQQYKSICHTVREDGAYIDDSAKAGSQP